MKRTTRASMRVTKTAGRTTFVPEMAAAVTTTIEPTPHPLRCPTNAEAKRQAVHFTDKARVSCSFGFEDLMVVVTLFVLFGDDIRVLAFPKEVDPLFLVLVSMSFVLFTIEFFVYSWSKTTVVFGKPSILSTRLRLLTGGLSPDFTLVGYIFGFYFWLDLLSVVSMFPDVAWIAEPTGLDSLSLGGGSSFGATAKLGRVARMVRLVRLVKLYKAGASRLEAKKRELELIKLVMDGVMSPEEFQDEQLKGNDPGEKTSKVGAELSDTTTRRVIAIVLLMLCVIPLLSVSANDRAPNSLTRTLQSLNVDHDTWNLVSAVVDVRAYFEVDVPNILSEDHTQPYLLYLEVYPSYPEFSTINCFNSTPSWQSSPESIGMSADDPHAMVCMRKEEYIGGGTYGTPRANRNVNDVDKAKSALLRSSEILGEPGGQGSGEGVHYSSACCLSKAQETGLCNAFGPCYVRYKFNLKVRAMDEALLSIITTLFVALMLVVGAHTFTVDAERLVLNPIQDMLDLVQRVSEDPSRPLEQAVGGNGQYETRQIGNAIKKITDLLRIGFGVAGSEIIRDNLSLSSPASGECIDLLTNPGKRIYSVFGFCMIEDFDHMTDKLGDDIMEFINDVAGVVHENVSAWGGQCNKNLGGSFLMTWKVPEAYTRGTNVDVSRIPYIAKIADRALIGFLKVTADLNRNEKILAYRRRADLQVEDKATGKMAPFKVRMGFGLHVGWGIEGPVGSMQKVDATYLSPHVNMAARCETAAKQWHVPVLCTDVFYACLSNSAQKYMRQLDKIIVKGSATPMNVYTFDAFQDQEMVRKADRKAWGPRGFHEYTRSSAKNYDAHTTTLFDDDPDLVRLRRHVAFTGPQTDVGSPNSAWLSSRGFSSSAEFGLSAEDINEEEMNIPMLHSKGIKKYLDGDWEDARDILTVVDKCVGRRMAKLCLGPDLMDAEDVNEGVIGDGPSRTILAYMARRGHTPPTDWDSSQGRALTSK